MPRGGDLETLKEQHPIEQVIGRDVHLTQKGREWWGLCPFHQEDTPSFSVNAEKRTFYCHGCREGGDVVTYLMKRHNWEFKQAVGYLAGYTNGGVPASPPPAPKPPPVKPAVAIPEETVSQLQAALRRHPEVLQWMTEYRRWSPDIIDRYELGYQEKTRRICIPIRGAQGHCINIRRYAWRQEDRVGTAGESKKIIQWAEGYGAPALWPLDSLQHDTVYLMEGEPDTLLALTLKLPAITQTHGAGAWKPEWTQLFQGKQVIVIYDNDRSGREGAEKVAVALASVATVKVVQLPEGQDFTDWVRAGGTRRQFESLIEAARVVPPPAGAREGHGTQDIDAMIQDLPERLNVAEHHAAWRQLVAKVAALGPLQREQYVQLMKRRFGFSVQAIRQEIKEAEMALKVEPPVPKPLDEPRPTDACWALDYRDGKLQVGIWLPTNRREYVFRLITSARELLPAPEEAEPYLPHDTARWSVDRATPYNVFAYLGGKGQVNGNHLLRDLESFFRRFMWYPDARVYVLLAIWTMSTYVFMIFESVSYLALVGMKRSGKTRLMEILAHLAFNGELLTDLSKAYMFRLVDRNRATLLLDESDDLQAAMRDPESSLLAILRGGYKRSGKVGRVEGETLKLSRFGTYSPKVLANVSGLESALEDRCIHIQVERKPERCTTEPFITRILSREIQVLRNRLYCWALQDATAVAGIYQEYRCSELHDREEELWSGMLSIARHLGGDLERQLITYAVENRERKELREGLESYEAQLLAALWQCAQSETPDRSEVGGRRWFSTRRLADAMREALGWDKLSVERLSRDLVKLRVIDDSSQYKARQRVEGKLRVCLLIEPERIQAAAERFKVQIGEQEPAHPPAPQQPPAREPGEDDW